MSDPIRKALAELVDAASNYVKPRRAVESRQLLLEALDAARAALAEQPSASESLQNMQQLPAEPVAYVKTWHKNGEQHAELWNWGRGIESLLDGGHLLYTSPAPQTAEQPSVRDDGMPASKEERHLRRLLAGRVNMPHAYYDDGEAHGVEHGISIDFMREPVADIDAKLRALGVARYECDQPSVREPLTDDEIKDVINSWWRDDLRMKYAELCRLIEAKHGIGVKGEA